MPKRVAARCAAGFAVTGPHEAWECRQPSEEARMSIKQQRTFLEPEAPWDADDTSERLIATVVFSRGPQQPFDYLVPDRLREAVRPGSRVRVPLGRGNRPVLGYAIALESKQSADRQLKEVAAIVDERPLLSPPLLRLTQWMADRYLCGIGQVLETVIPAGVRGRAGTRTAVLVNVAAEVADRIAELDVSPKQRAVLQALVANGTAMTLPELAKVAECTQGPIQALRRRGYLQAEKRRIRNRELAPPRLPRQSNLVLNADQTRALDAVLEALRAPRHETLLLYGVTGSGKTEVYIQAIQEVVGFGRQAIVLVPEISLTPQTVGRFRQRFQDVAVLHSHLSDAERHWHWQQIASGAVPVVVGARSAIFAPTPHLGLVVLDEEHEATFKQESAPRYHARDVALERARAEGVPLLLGSATPSLESWHRARTGEYGLLELPRRVLDRPLPAVGTIDLRQAPRGRGSFGALSRPLVTAMERALDEGGQVILLLNRRGFSTHLQCPSCGKVVRCPHCDIALTHHRAADVAICHYCDYRQPPPQDCPECRFPGIRYGGLGTQRLEAEVRARFPQHRALRMDTDSMQRAGSHERALDAFRNGEVRILLGTQMIAKGLDFPNVTLVGVVNADTALHLPDFRAAERTFQLLAQVAGRTGRGERGGRVLIQTFDPDHPAVRAAVLHDYRRFAAEELPIRQQLGYPPFGEMIRVVVRGTREHAVRDFAQQVGAELAGALGSLDGGYRILGPAPAPIAKLRGQFRYHLQANGPDARPLRDAAAAARQRLETPDGIEWMIDIDPLSML